MAEMRSFDRRRRLADALLQQSLTPGQGGQMVGRYYVGSGLTDGLTKLGQALIARSAYKRADEEESAFKLGEQQKQQAAMEEFTTAISPREELDFGSIDNVLNQSGGLGYKTVKPTSRDLGMALLKARSAGLDVDKDAASLMMGDTAPVEALGVVQTDKEGNVWNLDKRGRWNMAPFSGQPKSAEPPKTRTYEDGGVKVTEEWNGSSYVPIAQAPIRAPERPKPQLVQTDAGFEWVEPGEQPAGKPKPAGGAEPTESERKSAASGLVMDAAEADFFAVNGGNGMSGTGYYADKVPVLGEYLTGDTDQKSKQAMVNWVREKLRLESGATIGEDEAYQEAKRYFPVPGDKPETIAQKAAARKVAKDSMRLKAGRAAQSPSAPAAGGFSIKRIK